MELHGEVTIELHGQKWMSKDFSGIHGFSRIPWISLNTMEEFAYRRTFHVEKKIAFLEILSLEFHGIVSKYSIKIVLLQIHMVFNNIISQTGY